MKFSRPVYGSGKRELSQIVFGGYNHTRSASEGEIYDMKNLTSADYPVLSTRPSRVLCLKKGEATKWGEQLGYRIYDGYYCDCAYNNENGEIRLEVGKVDIEEARHSFIYKTDDTRRRTFNFINNFLTIFPDKKYIKLAEIGHDPTLYDMDASISSSGVICKIYSVDKEYSCDAIQFPTLPDLSFFSDGDAVIISGCKNEKNNKTAIILKCFGGYLFFENNTFEFDIDETPEPEENITVTNSIPDLDFVCEHSNRLSGCKGDTIYVSKLGNPLVWHNYEGVAGAWTVDVGSSGDFTGCFSYGSYVYFFKEETVYKLYGNRPDNYQLSPCFSFGVKNGSSESLAIASDILFYHSNIGIMAYTGGSPRLISSNFGDIKYKNAIGGSDGVNYYVSLENEAGERSLFKYDTLRGIWMKEDNINILDMFFFDGMYFVEKSGNILSQGKPHFYDLKEEKTLSSYAEFGDFYTSLDKKVISRLYARFELEAETTVKIFIKFDSGEWEELTTVTAEGKRTVTIPIVPRRCDHYRIKIDGVGTWRLYALSREGYTASKK